MRYQPNPIDAQKYNPYPSVFESHSEWLDGYNTFKADGKWPDQKDKSLAWKEGYLVRLKLHLNPPKPKLIAVK